MWTQNKRDAHIEATKSFCPYHSSVDPSPYCETCKRCYPWISTDKPDHKGRKAAIKRAIDELEFILTRARVLFAGGEYPTLWEATTVAISQARLFFEEENQRRTEQKRH